MSENTVFNLCAKFNDDRLRNEKALVHWKSDNNNPKNKHKNNVCGHWGPVSESKNNTILTIASCKLQHATGNLQQTYITTAIKVARKWAAPRPMPANQRRVESASGGYHRLDGTLWLAAACKLQVPA